MMKLKDILNNDKTILTEGDTSVARKKIRKALKQALKAEKDYITALEEIRSGANSYYGADQHGPKKDLAIELTVSIRDGELYTANRNRFSKRTIELINKL